MRVCEKCSRAFAEGAPPDCDDPDCPYRDGLAALEGEDATLIDPNFDRAEVLATVARAQQLEEITGAPGTGATTRLDEPPLDVTSHDDDEDEVATTQANDDLRINTTTQPAPNDETTVEHDVMDGGPTTLSEEDALGVTNDPEAPTSRLAAMNLDEIELGEESEPRVDNPDAPTMSLDQEESDEGEDSDPTHVFEGADPAALMMVDEDDDDDVPMDQHTAATAEFGKLDLQEAMGLGEEESEPLKPKLTLADLRASLKNRSTDEDTAEGIQTLEEPTEDEPAARGDHTAEDEGAYEHDETAQMDAAEVEGVIGVGDPHTAVDGTMQLDDGDLLDFADELLDDGGRTTEMSKNLSRRADAAARAMSDGVSTTENTRPVPVQQDTTQQDQPSPQTVESLIAGAAPQPPQTYPQPQAPNAYPQQADPYGSGIAQYPPQGPAGSPMFGPPGYDAPPPGQFPQPQQPQQPEPYGAPPEQPLVPYEQQFLTESKPPRIETLVILGIIVLCLVGVVLIAAIILR